MGEYNCKQQQLVKSSHITLIFHHEKTKGTILHHILSFNFINNSDAKTSSQKNPLNLYLNIQVIICPSELQSLIQLTALVFIQ